MMNVGNGCKSLIARIPLQSINVNVVNYCSIIDKVQVVRVSIGQGRWPSLAQQ